MCGKVVYVGDIEQIETQREYLMWKYPRIRFTKGNHILQAGMAGWSFQGGGGSSLPRNFIWVLESGIYGQLEAENIARMYLDRSKVDNVTGHGVVKPLVIYEGLATLFILCGGTLCCALISVILEDYDRVLTTMLGAGVLILTKMKNFIIICLQICMIDRLLVCLYTGRIIQNKFIS